MSYHNDEIDFRKIIEEAKRKESERWKIINEHCKKNGKKHIEYVRESFEGIKRTNKKKYDKIKDKKTPYNLKVSLIFEDIMTTIDVKKSKRRKK